MATIEDIDVVWGGRSNRGANRHGGGTLYGWYYMTQAKFREGGAAWKRWNTNNIPEFIESQQEDGHWEQQYGAVLSTTLACLSLEVYYRFLPTYTDGQAGTVRLQEQARPEPGPAKPVVEVDASKGPGHVVGGRIGQ